MIHRAEHEDNFTILSNEIIRDTSLSDCAKCLLIFMLSMSDEWSFSVSGLAYSLGWSEKKTRRSIQELKKNGFIVQVIQFDERGKFLPNLWEVYEVPHAYPILGQACDTPSVKQGKPKSGQAQLTPTVKRDNIRNTNSKEIPILKKEQREEEEKNARGEFQNVFLSQSEFDDLVHRFGDAKVEKYIEDLGDYLKTHPKKKYASHKRTIMNWIERDEKKAAPIPNNENPFTRLREEEGLL